MILINGKIMPSDRQDSMLGSMREVLNKTLQGPQLDPYCVIEACHTIAYRIENGQYHEMIASIGLDEKLIEEKVRTVIKLLNKESLLGMLEMQLGKDYLKPKSVTPPFYNTVIEKRIMPLGVLFHITAGNVDGLPVFSVIEGLLAGNINILKLPQVDQGLSIAILAELIATEPRLKEYIYVFDTPSTDFLAMKQMAELADGVVVWGGDEAVAAARSMVRPGTRIIEWGHKLSFAYITLAGLTDEDLINLASHIFKTKQLLCSSCQTIFIDTSDISVLYAFSERFIKVLEQAAKQYPVTDIGVIAETTLNVYNAELEAITSDMRVFKGEECSVIAKTDSELELSFMFGHCLVKRLPRGKIMEVLRRHKHHLQTVGLICTIDEKEELINQLLKAGVVRVKKVGEMSGVTCYDAHDGEYPLQRYSRVVESDW